KRNYVPITDFIFNSLYRDLKNQEISVTKDDLKSILHSDFVPQINPFKEFLNSIDYEDDGIDYIEKVASTIKTEDDDYFQWAFKKWFISLVAGVLEEGVVNETMLILLGKQGIGKTRWF